jgi:hypothetical protein
MAARSEQFSTSGCPREPVRTVQDTLLCDTARKAGGS